MKSSAVLRIPYFWIMKKQPSKNKVAILLMGSSLLLLGVFLAVWLKNAYQTEVSRLQEKSSFIFINSIRQAETDYIKSDLLGSILSIKELQGDSINFTSFKLEVSDETTQEKTSFQMEEKRGIDIKTVIQINSEKEQKISRHDKNGGAYISWLAESISFDSTHTHFEVLRDSFILNSIKDLLVEAPKIEDLPQPFQVIKLKDSTSQFKAIISDAYRDYDMGASYALAFEKTNKYIIAKILPQIGFSTLLFSITALSFFFVYKSLKDQQKLTELKNDLIANITHELKTPIATVGVAIEALQNFGALEDPKRTKEYLDISKQELNRLSILVDKVLNTSLFDKTDVPLKKEVINLKELVQSVLNSMKLQFQNKKAIVDYSIEGTEFMVSGDKIHLTSIIYNLLDNALKYSPLSPHIQVTLAGNLAHINFSVSDNGLGIPKEFQAKIFDKFFRVPTGNAHNIKGHGLGLNYVKNVVEKHGGQIGMQSEEGKGTLFHVSLPISERA